MGRIWVRLFLVAVVAALVPACGGGSSGGGGGGGAGIVYPATFLKPGGSGRRILTGGGAGTTGSGGNGGLIEIFNRSASDGEIRRTGGVDTVFTVPPYTLTVGSNPRTIATDTTFSLGGDLTLGSTAILGDDGLTNATALIVRAGATLTIEPNIDTSSSPVGADRIQLNLGDALIVEGTIRAGFSAEVGRRSQLEIYVGGGVRIGPTGRVDTAGVDAAPGGNGEHGGFLRLEAAGAVINYGHLTSAGGDGDAGGNGGGCWLLSSLWQAYQLGSMDSSGGTGGAGTGGNGGEIRVHGSYGGGSFTGGGAFVSGALTSRGGDGAAGGGTGGAIRLYFDQTDGPLVCDADADSSGGSATAAGPGGNAGTIDARSSGGTARVAGSFRARGGTGLGGNGGNGGPVVAGLRVPLGQTDGGGVFLAVGMDTRGGDGTQGGAGGSVRVEVETLFVELVDPGPPAVFADRYLAVPDRDPLYLVGYDEMDSSGGDGSVGGAGGSILLQTVPARIQSGLPVMGSLRNEADLRSRGGVGASAAGGAGGAIRVGLIATATSAESVAPRADRTVVSTGVIDSRGGGGALGGGAAGSVTVTDRFRAENLGSVDARGGAGIAGPGGAGGAVTVRADDLAKNAANVVCDGGNSAADAGGAGGTVVIDGLAGGGAAPGGAIRGRGGASAAAAGGPGSLVVINSSGGLVLSSVSGTASVPGGSGGPPGLEGTVIVDGVPLILTAGTTGF